MASDFASELGERFEHAGDKLRKLDLATLPVRKKAKKRSKLGMMTVFALIGGIAYAMYRMLREPVAESTFTDREMRESDTGVTTPRPAVRSA